jgi:hypothetical protein
MGWIDDVITRTTIRSVWGNAIRDRVVHQFASKAERDASNVHPVEGMCCQLADSGFMYVRRQGAWWVLAMPWAPFNPKAWFAPTTSPTTYTPLGIASTQVASWCQSMGRCHVIAQFVANLPPATGGQTNFVFAGVPITATLGGPGGVALVTNQGNGLQYGGGCRWTFNDTPNGSAFGVRNAGPGVPPDAVIPSSSATQALFFDINVTYQVAPVVDG